MDSLEMERVAARVRAAREAEGSKRTSKRLTQANLAYEVGLNAVTVYRIECGKTPSLPSVVALAAALDVSLDWLVLGRGPKRPFRRSSNAKKG